VWGDTTVQGVALRSVIAVLAVALLIAGCAAPRRAPVTERAPQAKPTPPLAPAKKPAVSPESRPAFHIVKKGETLYSIALEYGLDYKDIAAWNSVDPGRVQVGQQLRLTPPDAPVSAAPLKSAPPTIEARPLGLPSTAPGSSVATPGGTVVKSEPRGVRVPYSDQSYAQLAQLKPEETAVAKPPEAAPRKPEAAPAPAGMAWTWPAKGKVIGTFNGSTTKGIVIAGKLGQPVVASAAGKVIHSGTGIRGLGKFIVIKHNDAYLSVYAHNNVLLVKEGDSVTRGQKIAEMGNSDAEQVKLHFEIRHFGKPVDPARLLPDRPA
jgi:lipoprotein NlpD